MDENTKRKRLLEMKQTKRRSKFICPPKKKVNKKKKNRRNANEVNSSNQEQTVKNKKKYVSKKRIVRRRKIILVSTLILVLGLTLIILSFTVFFPIKTMHVSGNEKYRFDEILNSIDAVTSDNLLLASEKRANKVLKANYPYIKSIEFEKKLPFTLNVIVNEYEIFAQIKSGNGYVRVGDDGTIIETGAKYKKGSPVVLGVEVQNNDIGQKIAIINKDNDENIFGKVDEIVSAFNESKIGGVTLINFTDMQDIRVTYNNQIVMLLGSSANLEQKLKHAKATLEARSDSKETGTLNLSRIPSAKNEASFIPRELKSDEIAGKKK